jgi:hypothetical protein
VVPLVTVRTEAARWRDTSVGVNLQHNPRDSSHCVIGGVPQLVYGRRGMVWARRLECIAQTLERFQNPDANCRIEPAFV